MLRGEKIVRITRLRDDEVFPRFGLQLGLARP